MSESKEKNNISAVIVAHNEEEDIRDCLESVKFADEIVVVLDKCTDGTKNIVKEYTDKIIEGSWDIEGERRNVSLKACSGDWILEMDADERVTPELQKEILSKLKESEPCVYQIDFENYIGKRKVTHGLLRSWIIMEKKNLHYKGFKRYTEVSRIHPESILKDDVEIKRMDNKIIHLVDRGISDAIVRLNRYTDWMAHDMVANDKIKGGTFKYFRKGFNRFIKSFFFKKGYKEGYYGLFVALMAALYPILSYCKAKEIIEGNRRK